MSTFGTTAKSQQFYKYTTSHEIRAVYQQGVQG